MDIARSTALVTGSILNLLSALALISLPRNGAYCAAKSAEWSLTNVIRAELAPATQVTAPHVGLAGPVAGLYPQLAG